MNLYTFNLAVELVVVPVVAIIAMTSGVASIKPEHKQVKSILDFLLGIFGIILIVFTLKEIASDFHGFLTLKNLRDFLLPILLTLVFLPFIYLLALFIQYESLYARIRIFTKDKRIARHALRKVFLFCQFNLKKLNNFSKNVGVIRLIEPDDIDKLINAFKNS